MSQNNLITAYDSAPLNGRYWATFGLISISYALDYFDFVIVGFLVAVVGPQWHLTYLESAFILLSAGLGSIAGALIWGSLADRWGRRNAMVVGTVICGASAGCIALIPDGAWWAFGLLRFGVGFGLAGAVTAQMTLLVEITPTRHRMVLSSLPVGLSTFGILLASATAATLLAVLGWRGVAALGAAPVLVGLVFYFVAPESVRWLLTRGRVAEAREIVGHAIARSAEDLAVVMPRAPEKFPTIWELYSIPKRFWLSVLTSLGASTANYGVYLWGPTIVAMLLSVSAKHAAVYFIYVALVGMVGKLMFAFLPALIGRRHAGELHGYGAAATLFLAAVFHTEAIAGIPVFIVLLVFSALFFDGGFANLIPYTAEIFPVNLSGRGVGLAQAANGAGKILGPLSMALIAGASNLVTPKATIQAAEPVFIFLAASVLLVGLSFTFLAPETRGRALELGLCRDVDAGGV